MNMKKRYIYFLVGALLCGFIIVAFQISRAAVAYPNPGHPLTCHTVTSAYGGTPGMTATCDYGTATGGSCYWNCGLNNPTGLIYNCLGPDDANGWFGSSAVTGGCGVVQVRVVCCVAG